MRVVVAAVGRLKDGPERELAERYLERLEQMGRSVSLGPVRVVEIAESRARRPDDRKREEAAALIAASPGTPAVALDQRGTAWSSERFAAWIGGKRDGGADALCFWIGGADGLDPSLLHSAELVIGFGEMTWPHQIVRVMLAEQLYRAATILAGHPYHRP